MSDSSSAKQILKIPAIDYTSREFVSIRDDLIRSIPFYTPEWTDYNETNMGIVIVDLVAHATDVLHFYIDRAANEGFLPTAITRRSVINLLKLIDYELRSAAPASADVVFTLASPLLGPLLIPKGTRLSTEQTETGGEVLFFETAEDLTIPALALTGTVAVIEGETKTEPVGASSGQANQRLALEMTPLIDGTLQLFIDEGAGPELWEEVDNFVATDENDKHFYTQRDENDVVTIFFGDNVQGKIPAPLATIVATARVGGGARGNVGANTIVSVLDPILFFLSPVSVAVTNPLQASGGEDRQSIEEAKILGPQSLRALNRAVTAEDFETLAENFPGVAKAQVVSAGVQTDPCTGCCCEVTILIAPEGGGQPSSQLISDLTEFFATRTMVGTCIRIIGPKYVAVDLSGDVYVASNFSVDAVAAETLAVIAEFFSLSSLSIDFGTPVFMSDVIALIDGISGVDHVDTTKLTRKAVPQYQLWEENGAVFAPAVPGEEAVEQCEDSREEEWTLTWVDGTHYMLKDGDGLLYGPFLVGGIVDCDDSNNRIRFKMDPGTSAMCPGNRAVIRTAKRVGNVPMDDTEIPVQGTVKLNFVGGSMEQKACP